MEIRDLKTAYRIPAAWRDLGLTGEAGKICRSPFPTEHKRGDANPSFSVFDEGRRWRDFATGESGTVIDLIVKARGCNLADAIRFIQERLGIPRPEYKPDAKKKPGAKIPPLRRGTESELHALAERRGFNPEALRLAEQSGFLHFANLWGNAAWCIADSQRRLFEFRRLDSQKWPGYGRLPERKCHCMGAGNRVETGRVLIRIRHDTKHGLQTVASRRNEKREQVRTCGEFGADFGEAFAYIVQVAAE